MLDAETPARCISVSFSIRYAHIVVDSRCEVLHHSLDLLWGTKSCPRVMALASLSADAFKAEHVAYLDEALLVALLVDAILEVQV